MKLKFRYYWGGGGWGGDRKEDCEVNKYNWQRSQLLKHQRGWMLIVLGRFVTRAIVSHTVVS